MSHTDFLSGEKFQQLAQVYIGTYEDFQFNPLISKQTKRHMIIDSIPEKWENPSLLFCYSYRINHLSQMIHRIQNKCVIIFGNSDQNISYDLAKPFLDCEKIIHIFCQNIMFKNNKASFLPIGIANRQWVHGDPSHFLNIHKTAPKSNKLFCSFQTCTNQSARGKTLNVVTNRGITNKRFNNQSDYVLELYQSQFSICPEGNGLDTHRFWESIMCKTVPIVTRSSLTEQIQESGIPCVILESWDNFDPNSLPNYDSFNFEVCDTTFTKYRNDILEKLYETEETMNVVLSFIGKMPEYVKECIKQLRLFFKGPVYLIFSDIDKSLYEILNGFNVIFINYDEVHSERFEQISNARQFSIVDSLNDRKELFKRSYERIYLLEKLMINRNLTNIWFMEIDILMYVNPNLFLKALRESCAYSYHKQNHCSSAILYVKDINGLLPILKSLDDYNGFMSEMMALEHHRKNNPTDMLFPLIHKCEENELYWRNHDIFFSYIFDGATIGQYLFGVDPIHTNNTIIRNSSEKIMDHVKLWDYGSFEWINKDGLFLPYYRIKNTNDIIPIANLHMHSKDLISAVSYTPKG